MKNNVVFKDVNGGKKVEITFTIPVGCKPFVYRGKQKLEFKSHDNQISFSIDKRTYQKRPFPCIRKSISQMEESLVM